MVGTTTSCHLLLVSATQDEANLIRESLRGRSVDAVAGKTVIAGQLAGVDCRVCCTGIGLVNAAHALTCELQLGRPRLVIQFGIAGAYVPSGLEVGAVALATEEVYGDVGVITPDGWKPADAIGIPLVPGNPPLFNRFPLQPELVACAARFCDARRGPFVTVSQCTGVRALGDELHARFGALCESMEGAAAAHLCTLYEVPFLELRGVSNLVDDRDRSTWQITRAAEAAQRAVIKLVENLDRFQWNL